MDYLQKMKTFHEKGYRKFGKRFQRRYPNEHVIKFVLSTKWPRKKWALDLGCGCGGNMRFLIENKFNVVGIDCCEEAINITKKQSKSIIGIKPKFTHGMLPWVLKKMKIRKNFDLILDCLCSYTLKKKEQIEFLENVRELLTHNGIFFSIYPSKNSCLYKKPGKIRLMDKRFLPQISRKNTPFPKDKYGWNFETLKNYSSILRKMGFKITKSEKTSLTYRNGKEILEYLLLAAKKNGT